MISFIFYRYTIEVYTCIQMSRMLKMYIEERFVILYAGWREVKWLKFVEHIQARRTLMKNNENKNNVIRINWTRVRIQIGVSCGKKSSPWIYYEVYEFIMKFFRYPWVDPPPLIPQMSHCSPPVALHRSSVTVA